VHNLAAPAPVILAVAIDTPLRRVFDYRPPNGISTETLEVGQRIWVPFGRRRVVGVIVELRSTSDIPAAKLRAATEIIDSEPTFDAPMLALLTWSADYYRHPIGEVIASALPVPLRLGASLAAEARRWQLTAAGRDSSAGVLLRRSPKMRAALDAITRVGGGTRAELEASAGVSGEILRKLAQRGLAEEVTRVIETPASLPHRATPGPQLNADQQIAVERIQKSLGDFHTWLLDGVTGSGKTEVYLRVIDAVLTRGEQALVLVPEIALTPQLVTRFRKRFDVPIGLLHSGLSDGERLAAWRAARSGEARIVIGTRSAVFVPLKSPGLIIIDEEHDSSFKQQEGFRYSARDLAIVRAQRSSIPIVLGSATPSLESLARAQRQQDARLRLSERAGGAQAPRWTLIDLRQHGAAQGIATPVLMSMKQHLDAGNQVLLFLNRRGYAPVLFCPACGWSAHCKRCDANLTVYRRAKDLLCHHCGAEQQAIETCPTCSAPVKPVGQGTERIEETVAQMFPNSPLARIDRDSMRRKGELEATLANVDRNEIKILVGTQMLTKGHHFPNVTLVVVLNADQGLFSTDFRASERLAQTIVQVAGRAGRAQHAGEVLIQTEYPEHRLLQLLLTGGYEKFATGALGEREHSAWPPFARIALLRAEAADPGAPMHFLRAAADIAAAQSVAGVRILGPAPAPMERRAGRYRAQLLLHAPAHQPLQRLLHAWIPTIESLPEAKRVRWSIDVDPIELF
jgi:primosomal protein N' (replication factor Y) (superfamily II helicase)